MEDDGIEDSDLSFNKMFEVFLIYDLWSYIYDDQGGDRPVLRYFRMGEWGIMRWTLYTQFF